ncbi:membrane protein FAM174B-like isoform X2 [Cataglyphis hispanica]|uniref:membrane protein FAM174B-like isoform X2 n=1 Tax=Cataglyphis hispanica TaxID=1086592 RepID=UPI002180293B|nr:membrane protein FAM174B-like isoform X2 [Cataglyphis hispanica]
MTRSKIQKMKFFVFLLIFLLAQTAICDGSFREKRDVTAEDKKKVALVNEINKGVHEPSVRVKQKVAELSSDAKKPATDGNKTQDNITSKSSSDVTVNRTHIVDNEPSEDHTTFNTGALVRGFLVFVGLSILVMAYIVFRSFRLSKTRAQLVRKYGVLTHRQDVEMRPLPLEEEDDEDTTVFDASNVVTTNIQHQNA